MAEALLKPTILPEAPEHVELLDDQTVTFLPQFGRLWAQRNSFADPRWRIKRTYKAMRAADVAQLMGALQDAQGAFKSVRAAPTYRTQGSFPDDELHLNSDFSQGTTSWTDQANVDAVVVDGVYRILRTINDGTTGGTLAVSQAHTLTAFVPYLFRAFVVLDGGLTSSQLYRGAGADGIINGVYANILPGGSALNSGLRSALLVPGVAGSYNISVFCATTTDNPNDFQSVHWASCARCALVDTSPNMLLQSDDMTTTWTNNQSTDAANSTTAPDGTLTADSIIEDATVGAVHSLAQSVTVGASTGDLCYTVALKASTRTWAALAMFETTGSTQVSAFFNLATGVVGTLNTGANWANIRAYSVSLGNGWWRYYVIARKTNAATTVSCRTHLATADNTATYNGDGVSLIYAWRAGFQPGGALTTIANVGAGLPFIPAQTTTVASSTGTLPTANQMRLKGLPASTNGLLVPGDFFEINGELKQATAALNSDAAGCGLLNFRPGLHVPPTNNDPVIFCCPMGTFRLADNPAWDTTFGAYADFDVTLEEVGA